MKISLAIVLCLALAMSSAFKIRQGNNNIANDINAAVGATNQAITDSEELFNDSLQATQGVVQNFATQALNGMGAMANLAQGNAGAGAGAAPAPAPAAPAGGRLQQNLANAATVATNDATNLATDATTVATDAANVAADLGAQFVNTATNFIGGMAGNGAGNNAAPAPAPAPAQRLQQGNLATDINALNQDTLNTIQDAGNSIIDSTQQAQLLANNAIATTEQAFGVGGAAVPNPDRLQQANGANIQTVTADATDVAQDLAQATNNGIQAFNDLAQQGLQAFNGIFTGATGAAPAAPAAAPAGGRRLQRFN